MPFERKFIRKISSIIEKKQRNGIPDVLRCFKIFFVQTVIVGQQSLNFKELAGKNDK